MYLISNIEDSKEHKAIYVCYVLTNDSIRLQTYTDKELREICRSCYMTGEAINASLDQFSGALHVIDLLHSEGNIGNIITNYIPVSCKINMTRKSIWYIMSTVISEDGWVKEDTERKLIQDVSWSPLENVLTINSKKFESEVVFQFNKTTNVKELFKDSNVEISGKSIKVSIDHICKPCTSSTDINYVLSIQLYLVKPLIKPFLDMYDDIVLGYEYGMTQYNLTDTDGISLRKNVDQLLNVKNREIVDLPDDVDELMDTFGDTFNNINRVAFYYGMSQFALNGNRLNITMNPEYDELYQGILKERALIQTYYESLRFI